jgi:hypothetical protein
LVFVTKPPEKAKVLARNKLTRSRIFLFIVIGFLVNNKANIKNNWMQGHFPKKIKELPFVMKAISIGEII